MEECSEQEYVALLQSHKESLESSEDDTVLYDFPIAQNWYQSLKWNLKGNTDTFLKMERHGAETKYFKMSPKVQHPPVWKIEIGNAVNHGVGDSSVAKSHLSYRQHISDVGVAQEICDAVCRLLDIPSFTVLVLRKCSRYRGRCHLLKRIIELYPSGMVVGILLHEIAHHATYRHDRIFKRYHAAVIRAYDGYQDILTDYTQWKLKIARG